MAHSPSKSKIGGTDMVRDRLSMNEGWRFYEGEIGGVRNRWAWGKSGSWNQGPESIGYDDSGWREVELPHDFVIESTPYEYSAQEFGSDNTIPEMDTVKNIHTTAGSFKKDVGWYRKHFYIDKQDLGRRIYIAFDGVYRDSSVYVNNFFVGHHQSGYTPFEYDISDFLNYGGDNVIVVYVDARVAEGWFYEGGGIYRNVWLYKTAPVHVKDVYVNAVPQGIPHDGYADAKVEITLEISSCEFFMKNGSHIDFAAQESAAVGKEAQYSVDIEIKALEDCETDAITISSNLDNINYGLNKYKLTVNVHNAALWDIDSPCMYLSVIKLFKDGECIDCCEQDFGIRSIYFDADEGFLLNGRKVKLNGVCCHQNHGGIGSAMPGGMYRYRLLELKELGVNAYRTSHYCPAPELLYWCDRLGILVMDETRLLSSAMEDLNQLEAVVRVGRNHPSVIMYSIGNEEAQSELIEQGGYIARTMINHVRSFDASRPVTMGLLLYDLQHRRKLDSVEEIEHIGRQLDICGFNYHHARWQEYKDRNPNQPIVCTEASTIKGSRGCYETDKEKCLLELSMMDTVKEQMEYVDKSYVAGAFLWTGFDYYGEPTPFAWPAVSSQFGLMDLSGNKKDGYYYFKALYKDEPLVHIAHSWKGVDGEKKDIVVFTNCSFVELFVNGRSLGGKKAEKFGYLTWKDVIYESGELMAVGDGKAAEDIIVTPGMAAGIKLKLEYFHGDILIVNAAIVDTDGNVVQDEDSNLKFIAGIVENNHTDKTKYTDTTEQAKDSHRACISVTCESESGFRDTVYVPCRAVKVDNEEMSYERPVKIRLLGTSSGCAADHVVPGSNVRRSFNGLAQAVFKVYNF